MILCVIHDQVLIAGIGTYPQSDSDRLCLSSTSACLYEKSGSCPIKFIFKYFSPSSMVQSRINIHGHDFLKKKKLVPLSVAIIIYQ